KYFYGELDGFSEGISADESGESEPFVKVIKEGTHYVCNDIETNVQLKSRKDEFIKQGFKSFAAFPIKVKNKVVAVYNVYSENINVFEKQETDLLLELANDISFALEYIEVEQERRLIEGRYRNIVETAPIGIILSVEGKLAYANPEFVKIMRAKSPEELLGKEVIKFIHPEFHDAVGERRKRILKGLSNPEIEQIWSRMDGSNVYLSVSAIPYYLNESIIGVQVLVRDITERRKMIEDLKISQARLKGIVDSAMDAIITIDSNKKIVVFNESAEIMFGYKSEDVFLKKLNILIPQRFHEVHDSHIDRFGGSGATSRSMVI
ncbi:MAG: PAS domain S-box protein, partial [Chlorobi bacterium]|nr:PAS domain S-box protein [Chlorobiota bacterium]